MIVAVDNPYIPSRIKGYNIDTAQVAGAINTEMKCLLLGTLTTDEPASHFDIYDQLVTGNGGDFYQPVRAVSLLGILQQMPGKLVRAKRGEEFINGRKRKVPVFTKTAAGQLATAWAGENLAASSEFITPIRYVFGEKNDQRRTTKLNTFDARLTILYGLAKFARSEWVSLRQFSEVLKPVPLTTDRLLKHMGRLSSVGLVEVKNQRYHGNIGDSRYRVARHNGYFDPGELIESYAVSALRFTNPRSTYISEGHRKMKRILADSKLIPLLVRRSYASSGHTDKPHGY